MEAYQDYDAYAYAVLNFVCSNCGASIDPPEWFKDCDEEYCYYIARKAESTGWFIACDEHMTCYCPSCREKVTNGHSGHISTFDSAEILPVFQQGSRSKKFEPSAG